MSAVLLPYQKYWIEDLAPIKIIEKSRRIGISYCEAADAVLYSASEGGANTYYISYNKEMTAGFIQDCASWANIFNRAAGKIGEKILSRDDGKDIHVFDIPFPSGHKIQAFSGNPRNLRSKGRPGEHLVVDEAAFIDDIGELLKAAMAMTMWGGCIHIISTHNGDENPFNLLIKDVLSGRYDYSLHRVTLDDALNDGLYKRICTVTGQEWSPAAEEKWRAELIQRYHPNEDEELFCVPSKGSGVFMSSVLIESCMSADIPVLRVTVKDEFKFKAEAERTGFVAAWCEDYLQPLLKALPANRRSYCGEDFGRTGDLTVLTPLQEQQDCTFRAPFVLEVRNMPFEQQKQIVFYLFDNLPMFTHASFDSRGNGQYLAEVAAQNYGGARVSEVMISEKWYREIMPKYKTAFEDKAILLPRDADVVEDHRALKMVKGVAKILDDRSSGSDGGQRHGDSAISGAMAWHATMQAGGGRAEYTSVTKRRINRGAF